MSFLYVFCLYEIHSLFKIYGFSSEGDSEDHSSNGIFLKCTGLVEIVETIPSPNDHREDICSVNVVDTSGTGTAGIESTATAIESYTVLAMSSLVGKVIFTNSIVHCRFTQLMLILITLQCLYILFVNKSKT